MVETIPAVQEYDAHMRRLTVLALAAGRKAWRALSLNDLTRSGEGYVEGLAVAITGMQERAARAGSVYSATALAQQGTYSAPLGFVNPAGFAGFAPDGRPLASLLYSPVTQVKTAIGQQRSPFTAMRMGGSSLDRIVQTVVSTRAARPPAWISRPDPPRDTRGCCPCPRVLAVWCSRAGSTDGTKVSNVIRAVIAGMSHLRRTSPGR